MSKNVAVFVDVANIFYAAKAAGVDIDYVTLLKSAVAGRDFVRAYAYTGLDPDNENQRQFHSFLARHGYKVISKDIRKYGDGRIKANLDIELVVDLMRLARNLDIAVVVSGDGDFAPAIRAVQQMGVRVEVISFRGNTSSDLIEVADSFTDIAQIARVDKASARSGRRVAAEGDLSMTEVPEKETEGVPRRQRGRRSERAAAAPAAPAASDGASNLIVLPGERLSRVGEEEEVVEQPTIVAAADAEVESDEEASPEAAADGGEEGRRRRRRRGGRGRGRGRRAEVDVLPGVQAPDDEEEEEDFEEVAPAALPQHTFGSVWDSQLGVPSTLPTASAEPSDEEDEDYEEPEIPEYLLAERRQGGGQRRGRMSGGRHRAGYQAALDRERFGRSGVGGGFAGGGGRTADRQRGDRQRGRQQQRPPRGDRQPHQRPPVRSAGAETQASASAAPWSEVPPELEELLLAELARKGPAPEAADGGTVAESEPAQSDAGDGEGAGAADEKAKRITRRRTTKAAAESDGAGQADADGAADEKPKRTTRRRTTKAAAASAAEGQADADGAADEKPKRTTRRRTTKAAAASAAEGQADADGAADEKPKRTTRRRTTKAAAESDAGEGEGAG